MAIKRYSATKDNTITNAYGTNLLTRATGSNMGASDVLEVFSIYGQENSGSTELARILIDFPVDQISADRTAGTIPISGSVDFILNLYNAKHAFTLPRDFKLVVFPVSTAWEEGIGLDMEDYSDKTKNRNGSNWIRYGSAGAWTSIGGDYESSPFFTASFTTGLENLSINISPLVENWIAGTTNSNGVGIYLSASYEGYFSSSDGLDTGSIPHNVEGATTSYYTKKFFARGSQNYYLRPNIEARWDSSKKDDRGSFYVSSSLVGASDNLNRLWMYNNYRGNLRNLPVIEGGAVYVRLYTSASGGTEVTDITPTYPITGGQESIGIYSASFAMSNKTYNVLHDRWYNSDYSICYYTGSFHPKKHSMSVANTKPNLVFNITNLKHVYGDFESPRLRVFCRDTNWCPTVYTKAKSLPKNQIVDNVFYRILRSVDRYEVIGYGTGSANRDFTRLSYDVTGNYFDLDLSVFERDYKYEIWLCYKDNNTYMEYPKPFNFRVE